MSFLSRVGFFTVCLVVIGSAVYVTAYAVRNAVGNLYYISTEQLVKGAQGSLNLEDIQEIRIQAERVEFWTGDNPQYLLYLAQIERWMGNASGYEPDIALISNRLNKANSIRPVSAHQYSQMSKESWYRGEPMQAIQHNLSNAQQLAPFDTQVALHSLDFYLSYWPSLSVENKVITTQYLISSNDYRITNEWELLFGDQTNKLRACSLLSFNDINNRYCE
ncbi:hypothetical protein F0231_11870 [Vibrio sp. RE86]|uniref:hypothetical protein n=1 Tax=Vibrio sp. RE86 TaxID=2607605 RepID=UPI0014933BD9|nr:hypothetical protein [Vibrio sp. RE86]NOH80436.1 hypothetical protein [Vibrio sp. RE86]